MDAADKRMLEREALRNMIQQWNANRLDLFELSEPNENLEFHGVMRFYFQDSGQKIATKCIRVASDATVSDVIETLIEKFRPDMRMLSLGSYSLWETHGPDDERRLEPHEKPLLVQLNWHADDREGRFLLKCISNNEVPLSSIGEKGDQNFKRKLSKREKKELKKKEKLSRLKSDSNNENRPVAEKLYTELPETSFTRSISNPEAVMRRRRQQKLERKLQQFRSKDGGPDTGGTLKIYGLSLSPDVPYKTLLLSVGDAAAGVVRETLDKYGLSRQDPTQFCIVQVDTSDNSEYILEDDECPLAIVMTHPHRSSIMFHVRRRPADSQPRRRKKKVGAGPGGGARPGTEPALLEVAPDGSPLENGRRVRITEIIEVGSGNGTALQLYGPSIQPRHCVVAAAEGGGYTVTPLHADAHVYVNGRRATHAQRLQHGCLLKFGRVSTFRFVDPAQETLLNRNLSQSQHFGSGSIYDRSPTSPENSGAMSPTLSHQPDPLDPNANDEYPRTMSPVSHDTYGYRDSNDTIQPYNNNTLKLDNESLMMSQHLNDSKDDYIRDEHSGSVYNEQEQSGNRTSNSQYKDNYETTFDLDGNVETKSICSAKSGGSGHENRMSATVPASRPGQEAILPAVLEFPEAGQAQFLAAVVSRLDPHAPAFKLAPVYTLYLCARYRASTHYRPELTPTERAHKLTAFLHHVATLIHATVQERCSDSAAQAFWMANASELLHFLKCDRHISSFSTQAQDLLPTTVQNAFTNLVSCFQEELARALATLTNPAAADATEATAPTLQALAAAMVLLRRCRVNAALTIQLFSHLFHYINAVCFNKLVTEPGSVSARWGGALSSRLGMLAAWAERQGLELAADCHLARTHQAARLIQTEYRSGSEVRAALAACFKLNSVQVRALLAPLSAPDVVEAAVAHARALADELCRADGREIRLEESEWLGAGLLIPGDGFSAEVVRGVPPGLAEFVAPLQRGGLCRLAHQPHAIGVWTVYMSGYGAHTRRAPDPRLQIIQLNKNSNGMGLSIVAAKGAGQSKLGIYIKSVVAGGAAAADGRLAAGDQLLSVDGHSLVGITQEKAAEYLVRTGPTVTLEVAKQGAVLHGLATLLHQPAYNQRQADEGVQYEDRARRNSGTYTNMHPALIRPVSPLTELATADTTSVTGTNSTKALAENILLWYRSGVASLASVQDGYPRRPCHDRCHLLRDESTESSTDESEGCHPHYHGSIPRLIITLDRENNQLHDDISPDTPGCPLELRPNPPRPIPVFTFTCEDFDELNAGSDSTVPDSNFPPEEPEPPPVPEPPANYDQSSESGDAIYIPPKMKPIDTKLTLDLFNVRKDNDMYRRRCTGVDECVSACECCRTPQPETQQIPFIDEPNSEPVIFENDCVSDKVATPKIRRILPSLSIDKSEEVKPDTADAVCQTPCSPMEVDSKTFSPVTTPIGRKLQLNLDVKVDSKKIDNIHCRLRRALFNMSKSYSKSEETEAPSTYSTTESFDEVMSERPIFIKSPAQTPLDVGPKQVLDSVDRKSWKSPDEYRPAFGKVKALAKHFNSINLKYCVKNYKRNCQSSPNLSTREDKYKIRENLPNSASLANIQYESNRTDTSETKDIKMSEDEVKSILIQLEDWSKYGSRGSEDTLAQGNEFELPNLPSEDHTDTVTSHQGSYVFNEIIDKKPKTITLDNIKLISNQSSVNSEVKQSKESLVKSDSSEKQGGLKVPREVVIPQKRAPLSCISTNDSRRESYASVVQSCPNIASGSARGRSACAAATPHHSCPALSPPPPVPSATTSSGGSTGALRRASERDLPARLAAEPVKPSKSTPALHHVASPPPPNYPPSGATSPPTAGGSPGAWASKSRSSHNLSQQSHDAFYQNLNTVQSQSQAQHAQQNRWSSLRSSGSTRPQSAHFTAANQPEQPPDSPLLQQANQANAMSARSAKLAEMSEEVTRRQQQQQMQYQSHQQTKPPSILPHQHPNQMLSQSHQQLNQPNHQQMLNQNQPSHQHMLNQNQPSHQQMLNHNQATHQPILGQNMHMHTGQPMYQAQQSPQMPHYQPQSPQMPHYQPQSPQLPHGGQMLQNVQNPSQQIYHNQHVPPQRYEWHPPGPPSPQRSQPPVAPKPQNMRRPESELEEHLHQQQMAGAMQPDDERYVASTMEPPAVSVYPLGGAGGAGGARAQPPHNPWQREERERVAEARRAANRARRDAAIAQLVALGGSRTPVQNQQLRSLQLERDFERRATQDQDEGANMELGVDEDRLSSESPTEPEPRPQPQPQPHPPKSILKINPRPEITNGYAMETMCMDEQRMSDQCGPTGAAAPAPAPPPPERGSSFAVMATHARALSPAGPAPAPAPAAPHHDLAPLSPAPPTTNHNHAATQPHSPPGSSRDKRVSFHAPTPAAPPAPPAPPASSPPPLHDLRASPAPREDPDRFIEEAESMLAGPASPTTPTSAALTHTPGVIGAQEVYRDPRARRLAEREARAAPAPAVPEQLSFKEKMKMFALESGEASTPKDKV